MKKLTSTIFVLFLIYGTASGQRVEINQKSIAKKDKFITTVKFVDGSRHKGKLVGYTDSTIVLSVKEKVLSERRTPIYYFAQYEIKYDKIETIIIQRRFLYGPPIIGALGGFCGTAALLFDSGVDSPFLGITLLTFGTIAITGAGTAISLKVRKRTVFYIYGNQDTFRYHLETIKLMVNER